MVRFDEAVDATRLPSHIAMCLQELKATAVVVDGNRVSFKGGAGRVVGRWNLLIPFEFGELTVDSADRQISYRLSLRQLVGSVTLVLVILAATNPLFKLRIPSWWFALAFVWLVGGNLVLGLLRFPAFVRRSVASAPVRLG
jgi:hypothetical protein